MFHRKKYLIGYTLVIFVLMGIYFYSNAGADSQTTAYFAKSDLPPGTIITSEDIEKREGLVLDSEKNKLLQSKDINELIGLQVTSYGIRMGRPVLKGDLQKPERQLYEMKLVGDITIPETAKLVTVNIIYDEKRYPGHKNRVLAENVPVIEVYNNQNIPIDMSDEKIQKVPRAISILVDEQQKNEILEEKNKGELYFTTIP